MEAAHSPGSVPDLGIYDLSSGHYSFNLLPVPRVRLELPCLQLVGSICREGEGAAHSPAAALHGWAVTGGAIQQHCHGCPRAEAITVLATCGPACLLCPCPAEALLPATRIPLPPRVLAAVQAMPPHMAAITVLSVSTLPVCLAIGPTWDGCTAATCMAGLRPLVPAGGTGVLLSHSKGEPCGKEGGTSPAAPQLSLPQTHATAWAKGVCRRAVVTLQHPEGFLSMPWAAGWAACLVVAVPDHAQCLPRHKAGPTDTQLCPTCHYKRVLCECWQRQTQPCTG